MKGGLLSLVQQVLGFALVGAIFFMWFLGHVKNNDAPSGTATDQFGVARAGVGLDDANDLDDHSLELGAAAAAEERRSRRGNASDLDRPASVTRDADLAARTPDSSRRAGRSREEAPARVALAVRDWKGVHRDEAFARRLVARYGDEVAALSEQHGLYPDVFMARLISYSYDFMLTPDDTPLDNNLPAMKRPDRDERAGFRTASESLKAYAAVNAGEITRLSAEGAAAKHDRAWTMRKIIERYAFVRTLGKGNTSAAAYRGAVGPASRLPEEVNERLELEGETIRITSSVENKVKERRAREAGYSNWDDYVENLPEEIRQKQEESTNAVISAVSKKKAFNLGRRVDAKRSRRNQE